MSGRITSTILDVASRSAGVCRRRDLLAAGVSAPTIDHRLRTGMLRRVGRGVYIVESLTNRSTTLHLAVASIPNSVLSHDSAAHLLGFPVKTAGIVHVLTDHTTNRTVDGVRLHRTRRWPSEDQMVVIDGVTATAAARTIIDLAATAMSAARLRHIVQVQVGNANPEPTELMALFAHLRRQGVRGTRRLQLLMVDLFDTDPVPASELEHRMADLLRSAGLTGFRRQVRPPWYDGRRGIVDFADADRRLIVETDGRRWHATEQAMAEDRRRDRRAAASGWTVLRVTWAEVATRPASIVADIRAVLGTDRSARAA